MAKATPVITTDTKTTPAPPVPVETIPDPPLPVSLPVSVTVIPVQPPRQKTN